MNILEDNEEIIIVTESSMVLMFGEMGKKIYDGNGAHRNRPLFLKPAIIHYPKDKPIQNTEGFDYVEIFLNNEIL